MWVKTVCWRLKIILWVTLLINFWIKMFVLLENRIIIYSRFCTTKVSLSDVFGKSCFRLAIRCRIIGSIDFTSYSVTKLPKTLQSTLCSVWLFVGLHTNSHRSWFSSGVEIQKGITKRHIIHRLRDWTIYSFQ